MGGWTDWWIVALGNSKKEEGIKQQRSMIVHDMQKNKNNYWWGKKWKRMDITYLIKRDYITYKGMFFQVLSQ